MNNITTLGVDLCKTTESVHILNSQCHNSPNHYQCSECLEDTDVLIFHVLKAMLYLFLSHT